MLYPFMELNDGTCIVHSEARVKRKAPASGENTATGAEVRNTRLVYSSNLISCEGT